MPELDGLKEETAYKDSLVMDILMALVLVVAGGFLTYLALDAARRAK